MTPPCVGTEGVSLGLADDRHEGDHVPMHEAPWTAETSGGLTLLIDRLWGQEVTHKVVLVELFRHTDLATRLELWIGDDRPSVIVEPGRGVFDLALNRGRDTVVFIELKFGAESGQHQRVRQREWAEGAKAGRTYILLGPSFFEIPREEGVHYIGVPELMTAIAATIADGALGELAAAYVERLEHDAAAWSGEHDPATSSSVEILKLYQEIADAWPVTVQPWRMTNPGGPDWILNADAWATVDTPGWEPARFYWEIAGRHLRFKVEWNGEPTQRMPARAGFERALEVAAREVGVDLERTPRKAGRSMTAAQLPGSVQDLVLVAGRVAPERARRLYDDATAVFAAAIRNLEPLTVASH